MKTSSYLDAKGTLWTKNGVILSIPDRDIRYDTLAFLHGQFPDTNFLFDGPNIIADRDVPSGILQGYNFAAQIYVAGQMDALRRVGLNLQKQLDKAVRLQHEAMLAEVPNA